MSLASYRRKQVKTYQERAFHAGCGGEWLSQDFGASTTFETKWLHRCDKCTQLTNLDDRFPRIVHETKK